MESKKTVVTFPSGNTETTIEYRTFTVVITIGDSFYDAIIQWIPRLRGRCILTASLKEGEWKFSSTGTSTLINQIPQWADCYADAVQRTAEWNG